MTKLLTSKFRVHLAEQLRESIAEESPSQYYLVISNVQPWENETSPPSPDNSVQYTDYDIWRGSIGAKRVSNNDISLVIPRYTWSSNTVYDQYSHLDTNLYSKTFYVITDEDNVYKCLFNNRTARSTVKPTGTSTSTITTADGYKWKFMYSVSGAEKTKYFTENFIPVKTLTADDSSAQWAIQQAAANGAIPVYGVLANGTGYLTDSGTLSSISNSTVIALGPSATGTDGAYTGSTVYISAGTGAGQIRDIISYLGSAKQCVVNTGFTIVPDTSSTYLVGPKINITGDGENALAFANVVGGEIKSVTAINIGRGYSRAQVSVTANSSFGSGANIVGFLAPPGGHGSNPVYELGGKNVTLNVKLEGSENNKISANNNFRTFSLITDPLEYDGTSATNVRYDLTKRFELILVSGMFSEDEFVTGSTSGAKGRIVTFANTNSSGTNGILSITNVEGRFSNTETITGNTSGITGIINGITEPEFRFYTGKLLYTVNRVAIDRDTEQTEDIKITVKF